MIGSWRSCNGEFAVFFALTINKVGVRELLSVATSVDLSVQRTGDKRTRLIAQNSIRILMKLFSDTSKLCVARNFNNLLRLNKIITLR